MNDRKKIAIVGAGLAGSEAALVLARNNINVTLFEARPKLMSPAHSTGLPAELICSNSLKSQVLPSAHALLKQELLLLESPLLQIAGKNAVPAGSALAVDREQFSKAVEDAITGDPRITYIHREIERPPEGFDACCIAAGPLASEALSAWIQSQFSASSLHFYDAIAPIVSADTVDLNTAFFASRHEQDNNDYLNCPFTEEEYRIFNEELVKADQTAARPFEQQRFFEACLPIEVMAKRGYKALAFGPMKPIGLVDPRTGRRPYAVCQLRREHRAGESYNLVGFQTRLVIPEQKRVFRLIPGLRDAEFLRYGSIHRNTYLDSPKLLSGDLSFRTMPGLFLAGQICGNEGYTESIATGHLAALSIIARFTSGNFKAPPPVTALGALLRHVTSSEEKVFTPSNIHFGLFPPLDNLPRRISKKDKQMQYCTRALDEIKAWRPSAIVIFLKNSRNS